MKLCPRVPTQAMIDASPTLFKSSTSTEDRITLIWQAMYDAARKEDGALVALKTLAAEYEFDQDNPGRRAAWGLVRDAIAQAEASR